LIGWRLTPTVAVFQLYRDMKKYKDNKMKNKKYNSVGTTLKSNIKIIERGKIDTPNTEIHARSLSWLSTGTF